VDLSAASDRAIQAAFTLSTEDAPAQAIKTPAFWSAIDSLEQIAGQIQTGAARFRFADEPLSVYEDTATIALSFKLAKDLRPGTYPILVAVEVQACDDQMCLAPSTMNITILLTVRQRSTASPLHRAGQTRRRLRPRANLPTH